MANNVDLNLLRALDAILDEQSVTKAAARLGLSQPAMSASLGKLRRHFSDELLTRVGNTYEPTPLARELLAPTSTALRAASRVFFRDARVRPGHQLAHVLRGHVGLLHGGSRGGACPPVPRGVPGRPPLHPRPYPACCRQCTRVDAQPRPGRHAARLPRRPAAPRRLRRRLGLHRRRGQRRGGVDADLGRPGQDALGR